MRKNNVTSNLNIAEITRLGGKVQLRTTKNNLNIKTIFTTDLLEKLGFP